MSNPWDEWKALVAATHDPVYPARLREMHKLNGVAEGYICRDCRFLLRARYSRVYLKCTRSRLSHGAATDWRAGWPACGLYEAGEREVTPAPK